MNGQGPKRIPYTASNPEQYRLPERSPGFLVVNMHISKTWRDKFEVYAGVENLLNYKQKDPILANDQPFSPYFDSSLVWGPVFGRNLYAGVRYRIK
ncbi:MAG: TonB-dependent receptor [Bacteroidales bacterium]|nr:TonB-dependent receptor [Bacteroidales bacterium]